MDSPKQNYTILVVLLAFMLSLLPEIGFSLGFGQIKLNSYLNEPLDAEIELQGAEDIDTSHLIVTLASVEDFKRIELARPYFLSKLRFEVVQQNKQVVLKVTSEDAVKQPYLEFLVQFTWPEGRVVRDYTLLLDPAPFDGVSKRAALEPTEPFQDPAAMPTLQEKSTKQENVIPPTAIAETKKSPVAEIQPIVNPMQAMPAITESKATLSQKQVLLGCGLAFLFFFALTPWFLKRVRSRVRLSPANSLKMMEDAVIFDEAIKLKLDLANQYLSCQDIQNAEAILDEIIARGNTEEIKLAEGILKKITR